MLIGGSEGFYREVIQLLPDNGVLEKLDDLQEAAIAFRQEQEDFLVQRGADEITPQDLYFFYPAEESRSSNEIEPFGAAVLKPLLANELPLAIAMFLDHLNVVRGQMPEPSLGLKIFLNGLQSFRDHVHLHFPVFIFRQVPQAGLHRQLPISTVRSEANPHPVGHGHMMWMNFGPLMLLVFSILFMKS